MFERCPVETADGDRRPPGWFPGAILLLSLLAFALRLPGLTWGTPVVWTYNSDNDWNVCPTGWAGGRADPSPAWKMVDRYRAEQERYGDILDRYEQIDAEMALIKAVEPEPCRVAGPAIYVYRVRQPGA